MKYCPECGSANVKFENDQKLSCMNCGLVYFQNVAAATACIISTEQGILFVERKKEPGKGKLGMPGGFINPRESAVQGVRRECREEIGFDPGADVEFFASFPNVYPYKNIVYHTCDLYFTVSAPTLKLSDLKIDSKETVSVHFIKPKNIILEDIAFYSAREALKAFLEKSSLWNIK
ncbi:MAG: NUDIX domain-containing protein [Treponema sp.]|jgi:ADP-ribose pyrophosphatase YjhB (NUDIX family)|nr:NUDIX domain-containing protein [Treponema sp.]